MGGHNMADRTKIYPSSGELARLGFKQQGSGDDPRDFWQSETTPEYGLQHTGSLLPAHMMPAETLTGITAALRKVKIKLSISQLRCLAVIVQMQVNRQKAKGLYELADLYDAYLLSEKLRGKMITGQLKINLSLKMNEARALYNVLDSTEFADFAVYEANLAFYIISEIDKQTV